MCIILVYFHLQRAPRSHSAGHASTLGPPGSGRRFGGPHVDEDEFLGLEEEDDIVAADLDMHSLILTSNPQDHAVKYNFLKKLRSEYCGHSVSLRSVSKCNLDTGSVIG